MKTLALFIAQFKKRGGILVLGGSFFSKFLSTLVALYVVRRLDVDEFGSVSYSLMLITPLVPLAGVALDFAYLKFGAVETKERRANIKFEFFTVGTLVTSLLIILIILLSFVFLPETVELLYFILLLFLLLSEFLLRFVQASLRVEENNKMYAFSLIWRALSLVVMSVIGVELLGTLGYVLSIVLSPLIVFLFLLRTCERVSFVKWSKDIVSPLKYGAYIGIGSVLSQLSLPLGGIIVTNMTNDVTNAALYKAASIIPFAFLMLPNMFFKAEFVYLAKNSENKELVRHYIFNYSLLALVISFALLSFSGIFSEQIMTIFFGEKYRAAGTVYFYMILGVCGALMLRQLFGNLLAVSGKANWNVVNAIFSLSISLPVYFYWINIDGVTGAAKAFAVSMWVGGGISALLYFFGVFRKLRV